ncbi:N2,N2-dimethylguanosine tRNA methyltransferase [Blastocladiella britannica]|nr:N2,N2-dimethylguanosine tRNA methyltransferase [Blastocladiella britannica]
MATPNTAEAAQGLTTFEETEYTTITEGQATILFPRNNEVFYNPVQQFNRDMSIAAIRTWRDIAQEERWARSLKKGYSQAVATGKTGEEVPPATAEEARAAGESAPRFKPKILEALAASGLRSVRYAREIPDLDHILCNDLEVEAVKSIQRNLKYNGISEELVVPNKGDAKAFMYQHTEPSQHYHVVDLDPYGSAAPFLDGAIQCVADGGLLCITCTDMQVLAGTNFPETTFSKYGGASLRADFCHEMALRLLLGTLLRSAAVQRRSIQPVLSLSIDFYIRIFVRVHDRPVDAKLTATKSSLVYLCHGCHDYVLQPMGRVSDDLKKFSVAQSVVPGACAQCGRGWHVGGPIYNGPLHDAAFVSSMLGHVKSNADAYGTAKRMEGMLTVVSEEIHAPLYRSLRELTSGVASTSMSLSDIGSALLNAGYAFSLTHACPTGIKTDAPSAFIWDLMRAHVARQTTPAKDQPEGSVAAAIRAQPGSGSVIDWTYNKLSNPPSRKIKLTRFQENPTKNWGPKARAGKKRPADGELKQPKTERKRARGAEGNAAGPETAEP